MMFTSNGARSARRVIRVRTACASDTPAAINNAARASHHSLHLTRSPSLLLEVSFASWPHPDDGVAVAARTLIERDGLTWASLSEYDLQIFLLEDSSGYDMVTYDRRMHLWFKCNSRNRRGRIRI